MGLAIARSHSNLQHGDTIGSHCEVERGLGEHAAPFFAKREAVTPMNYPASPASTPRCANDRG